jgi:hypothetical protein
MSSAPVKIFFSLFTGERRRPGKAASAWGRPANSDNQAKLLDYYIEFWNDEMELPGRIKE